MKTVYRTVFTSTLSVCLLGILAGWLLGHRPSNPQVATPSSQAAPDPVPEAVTRPTPPIESWHKVVAQPPQPQPEIHQATADLALTESASPINSLDLNQSREWARNNPAEALAWLTNAPDSEQRFIISEVVCSQLSETNPAAAAALAENCLGSNTNNLPQHLFLLGNMTQQWAAQDLPAASAWALAKPPGEERDGLLQRIAMVTAEASPADAARLISEQMSPGQFQNEAAISVLDQWTKQDAAAAMAWAESFPQALCVTAPSTKSRMSARMQPRLQRAARPRTEVADANTIDRPSSAFLTISTSTI